MQHDTPKTNFDAILVEGNLDIIHAMTYDVPITIGCYTGKPRYSLLLCTEPYQIWLIPNSHKHAADTKAAIINWLSNRRAICFPPHSLLIKTSYLSYHRNYRAIINAR